ncbi:hypothetical protein SAMN02746065_11451 [Desulfocicer vacuolatum DSM 3385]|uniref:Uncharacterized protein n=1 Tax=Desulfocicer vacuolatum DSM 3385 TaxID=1121400 RepID=A0A1W2CYL0_9BACT|nr:hypothetical protein SAMN02746065_11451 [Desulfocicer vacuolatum DSM 3385]
MRNPVSFMGYPFLRVVSGYPMVVFFLQCPPVAVLYEILRKSKAYFNLCCGQTGSKYGLPVAVIWMSAF